jgi:hypothetical protein
MLQVTVSTLPSCLRFAQSGAAACGATLQVIGFWIAALH